MIRTFCSSGLLITSLSLGVTLYASPPGKPKTTAPLGLVRLSAGPEAVRPSPLNLSAFAVDELAVGGTDGVYKGRKDTVDYLKVNQGREWSRSLRGSFDAMVFVSFQVNASQTTVVDIAGARIGVTASPVPGSLQLMFDDPTTGIPTWKPLNHHIGAAKYDGKAMATLPTLTVCIDPVADVWHLYANARLIADHLPLIAEKKNDRRFVLRAGTEGAWITGLVLADENPIYEDDNANGIDDRFEKEQRGGTLLPANASKAERQALAQQWKAAQHVKPPTPFHIQRPMPDKKRG
jgi:hypothetical protein